MGKPVVLRKMGPSSVIHRWKRIKAIGRGKEGTVHRMRGVVRSPKGRERTIELVEKRFRWWKRPLGKSPADPSHRLHILRPRAQFMLVRHLMEKNRVEKWGLQFPTIVRLRERRFFPPFIVMSLLPIVKNLNKKEEKQFWNDVGRQQDILNAKGYDCGLDTFFPVRDRRGEITAIMGDFGTIHKIK